MSKSHGTGRACHKQGINPACEDCRRARREYARRWRATPEGTASEREASKRYRSTSKGFLANIRGGAKHRGVT